jgi:hypothetical protein
MNSNVNYTEAKLAGAPASIQPTCQFDSNWVSASNYTSNNLVVSHGLGAVPTQLTILFSPDQVTCYPLLWSWANTTSGNPVTISMNAATISLAIFNGVPLHGAWNPVTGAWTNWQTGYFRVFASR